VNDTGGFGAPKQPAKQAAPAKSSGGFGKPAQQQASAPRAAYSSGQSSRGPWARLSGGNPQGQGGTNVAFFPSKDVAKVDIAATSWGAKGTNVACSNTNCPNKNRSLRASIAKANVKYENGIVKIPVWISMKVPEADAMKFSQEVLEAAAEAAAVEESPVEE
jgi:hypothetical protein